VKLISQTPTKQPPLIKIHPKKCRIITRKLFFVGDRTLEFIQNNPLPVILMVGFLVLMVVVAIKGNQLPYVPTKGLLTPAELNFYRQLMPVIPSGMLVFSKVRIADVLQVKDSVKGKSRTKHFNPIAAKHFDFVLVDDQNMRILGAIELNDKSHDSKDRKERDVFVRKAMSAAQLPLFEVKATKTYKLEALKVELALLVSTQTKQPKQAHHAAITHVDESPVEVEQPPQIVNDIVLEEPDRLPKPLASFIDLPIEPTTRN
jgi:hypothetical protein